MTDFTTRLLATAVLILAAAAATGQEAPAAAAPANPYVPPACAGVFTDVACPGGFAVSWIEQFYNDGITSGCNAAPLEYCPDAAVTRAQMAVFVEKAMRGTAAWSPGNLGGDNTGLGAGALLNNSVYSLGNTAVGWGALKTQSFANGNSEYGGNNTAIGVLSLMNNQPDGTSDGIYNTGVGASSLQSNTIGTGGTGIGVGALSGNTTGTYNTALGFSTLNTNSSGDLNTAVGAYAGAASPGLSDATAIGYNAIVDASYHVRIGDTSVSQIGGQVAWSNLSDARHKQDIRDLDLGLDFVMQLRPVSFTMRSGNGRTDMGFVAQDVETLLGDDYNVLGIGGDADRTLSLRYTDLIAPLVKAVQEQQAQIAGQAATIEAQHARIIALETALAERESAVERRLTALERRER